MQKLRSTQSHKRGRKQGLQLKLHRSGLVSVRDPEGNWHAGLWRIPAELFSELSANERRRVAVREVRRGQPLIA